MKRTISTRELRAGIGEVVNTVRLRGDSYVIEQRGKPQAALIPLHIYENLERDRRWFAEFMNDVAESADMTEEEAMKFALAEVAAHRAEKREKALAAATDK